jgi:hypothetical protein
MKSTDLSPFQVFVIQIRKFVSISAFISALILFPTFVHGGEVTLAWDANSETDVAGYKIYYGTSSGEYSQIFDAGNTTQITIGGIQEGVTYYFAATAYNVEASESGFSTEVSYTAPAPDTDGHDVNDDEDATPSDPSESVDTDTDGVVNSADKDDDNDGMPDDWEILYGLNPLINDASKDSDGDGISNLSEYLSGTKPNVDEDVSETDPPVEDNAKPDPPAILSPTAEEVVSMTPELKTEAFYDPDPDDTHARSQWRIFRADDNFCVFDVTSITSLTSLKVPKLILEEDTAYIWQVRFFDSRGAGTTWSEFAAFTTDLVNSDLNRDGVLDHQEVDNITDLDHDGVFDRDQANIKCVVTDIGDFQIGISIRETDYVDSIVSIESENIDDVGSISPSLSRPNFLAFGLIHFKLMVKEAGDEVMVTLYLSKAAYDDGKWYKYNPVNDEWLDYSDFTDFSADRKVVYLNLRDGGFGDADGTENGIIVDPLALGTEVDHNSSNSDFFVEEAIDSVTPDLGCFISTVSPQSAGKPESNLRREIRGREALILFFLMVLAYSCPAIRFKVKQLWRRLGERSGSFRSKLWLKRNDNSSNALP